MASFLAIALLCTLLPVALAGRPLGSGALADDLEAMRQRLISTGFVEPQTTRTLQAFPYSSLGYAGYYYGYGYYSGAKTSSPLRRSLLGEAASSSGRELLSYPYSAGGGYYYGYYGYGGYGGYAPSTDSSSRRRVLSHAERLAELLSDGAAGFVRPGQRRSALEEDLVSDPRRTLKAGSAYPSYGGGYGYYYGYGY